MVTIGSVILPERCLLAPMAGVTDKPFRLLCRRAGAGLVYTEFVSAHGFIQDNRKTHSMLAFSPEERPLGVQIFGHDPEALAEAAQGIESYYQPDLIDINFGCPVNKVVRKGAGAALLKDLDKLEKVAAAVVKAVSLPVTAKIRSGWDSRSIVVPEVVKRLADAGVQAVAIHPRTAKQGYQGQADWRLIAVAKETVPDLIIVGNGDIRSPEDARRMLAETGCDAVMVGRGALGRPWLFTQIKMLLSEGVVFPEPSLGEKLAVAFSHFQLALQEFGEKAVNRIKKHLGWYFRGFPGAVDYRRQAFRAITVSQLEELFHQLASEYGPFPEKIFSQEIQVGTRLDQELQLTEKS